MIFFFLNVHEFTDHESGNYLHNINILIANNIKKLCEQILLTN